MGLSLVTTPPMVTSLAMGGSKYFVNQSTNNWLGMGALINLCILLHSWIWSEIWVDVVCWSEVNSYIHVSYWIGNWKCVKKAIAKALKSQNECRGNSMYHLATMEVRVLWKRCRRIEPSIKELDEHQRWKVITWFFGSSPGLPSNFGISDGSLNGKEGQEEA